jgi:hypothetical protein
LLQVRGNLLQCSPPCAAACSPSCTVVCRPWHRQQQLPSSCAASLRCYRGSRPTTANCGGAQSSRAQLITAPAPQAAHLVASTRHRGTPATASGPSTPPALRDTSPKGKHLATWQHNQRPVPQHPPDADHSKGPGAPTDHSTPHRESPGLSGLAQSTGRVTQCGCCNRRVRRWNSAAAAANLERSL